MTAPEHPQEPVDIGAELEAATDALLGIAATLDNLTLIAADLVTAVRELRL